MFEMMAKFRTAKRRQGKLTLTVFFLFLIFAAEISLDVRSAHAAATQNHEDYCGCGPKCRREKCCCKPSEAEPLQAEKPAAGSVDVTATVRKLICQITSPCSEIPFSSEVRGTRIPLPTAMILDGFWATEMESGPLCLVAHRVAYVSEFLFIVYRPPEI
jgi:hypothetical protein